MPIRVCILTTVHSASDTRIFHKQAKTLLKANYDVMLIAQHHKNEVVDGIKIIALPKPKNRLQRILRLSWQAFHLARREKAGIYHFHDPELLLVGLLLKLGGARVIYDVHEDAPRQILSKDWIPRWLRRPLAKVTEAVELLMARSFDAVIAATPTIAKRFSPKKTVLVQNFPMEGELMPTVQAPQEEQSRLVAYIGGISILRGIREMIQAVSLIPELHCPQLVLAGTFSPPELEVELRGAPGWNRVNYLGWQSRSGVAKLLSKAQVGLAVLHPTPNYLEAYPVKLFEYMSVGIPVVASNFPLWKEIVEGNQCGLTVNPLNPQEIAQAIEHLLDHPEARQKMGENGKRAVREKYNWEKEAQRLLALYEELLS